MTQALSRLIAEATAAGDIVELASVEKEEAPEVLSRHLGELIRAALGRTKGPDRLAQQARIANQVLEVLRGELGEHAPASDEDLLPELEQLLEVKPAGGGLGAPKATSRPSTPFGTTDVLMNLRGEPAIGRELVLELESADRVDLICSFLKWTGYCLLRPKIAELLGNPEQKLRVLTTTYVGVTERRVLDDLAGLGAEVKVSYEHRRTRLHAKAWLFHRPHGLTTAYVGSSNVSHSALVDGLEWNVRLSAKATPDAIDRIHHAFDALWHSDEFETYDPNRDSERFDRSRAAARGQSSGGSFLPLVDLRPHPFQADMLDRLDFARRFRGHHQNLVVAATGTGKTVLAALDFKRLQAATPGLTLLFVAHRMEILKQARGTFALALRDADFGEILAGGQRPEAGKHVFATIQSLTEARLAELAPDAYDMLIVDEFHHAEAKSYRRLLDHLEPKELLGLTATPERADGERVQDSFFEGRIAAELRLWDALEHELLVPFHYFGVDDNTDLSSLTWSKGGYDASELGGYYTRSDAQLLAVLQAVDTYVGDSASMIALGFCVGVEHARWMAKRFTERGLPAAALWGKSSEDERSQAIGSLRRGDLRVIFTADLFNEGVDIPEVNTVFMLRPTDSPVLFQQQLGRGLRRSDGKDCLTVLDFIGIQNRRFRMDKRLGQLCGEVTRTGVTRAVNGLFPSLPPGCSLQLERKAQEHVLRNLKESLGSNRRALVSALTELGAEASLGDLLEEARVDLGDLYRNENRTWSALRRDAGFEKRPEGPLEKRLRGALTRLTHIDDEAYLAWLGDLLAAHLPTASSQVPIERAYLEMLSASLFGYAHGKAGNAPEGAQHGSLEEALSGLAQHPAILSDLAEIVNVRASELTRSTIEYDGRPGIPLRVQATYTLGEALAGLGHIRADKPRRIESGVFHVQHQDLDAFFFTIQKTEKHYSPTTLYRDFALSPDLIHWESQSQTSDQSKTGQRYIHHQERNHEILLFAREARKDSNGRTMPYTFLGPADYVSHEGSKPVAIKWRLKHPMPPATYDFTKLARA